MCCRYIIKFKFVVAAMFIVSFFVTIAKLKMALDTSQFDHRRHEMLINCSNIHEVIINEERIGWGTRKVTYFGTFKGEKVVLKVVEPEVSSIEDCLKKNPVDKEQLNQCYYLAQLSLMKEILLLEQMDHPGVIKLKGYCLRDTDKPRRDLDPRDRGIIGVFEYAEKFDTTTMSLYKKIKTAWELADILVYLSHSPLGSFFMLDPSKDNFMFVNGKLKLIDVDLLNAGDRVCFSHEHCIWHGRCGNEGCEFRTPCLENRCLNYNAKLMIRSAHDIFFEDLLQCDNCSLNKTFADILSDIPSSYANQKGANEPDAWEIRRRLQEILDDEF